MTGNFLNLLKGVKLNIQEAEQILSRINLKKFMSRPIMLQFLKANDKNLESREKNVHFIES